MKEEEDQTDGGPWEWKKLVRPTVGRIVHYSDGTSRCSAAIVTEVTENFVWLVVFNNAGPVCSTANATQTAGPGGEGTWHWPEREEDPK